VVSCGALNSPALLLRSGIDQGPVGKKTWLHPTVAMAAVYRDDVEAFYGAPQSVASHHFAHRSEGAGFFLEAAPLHPMLAGIALPGFGARMRADLSLLPKTAVSIALLIDGFADDEEGGTVSLRPDGNPRLDYPFTPRHYECWRAGMKAQVRATSRTERPGCSRSTWTRSSYGRNPICASSTRHRSDPTFAPSSPRTRWAAAGWARTRRDRWSIRIYGTII
jgi:hypothetical protein